MEARKRWQHSIIISIVLNFLLLCGVGIVFAGLYKIDSVEPVMELELVSDDRDRPSVDNSQGSVSKSIAVTQVPSNKTVSTPRAVQTVTTLSIDEVTVDGIADHVSGETQALGSSTSGSASGSSAGSGQSGNGKNNSGQGSGSGKGSGGIIGPKTLSHVDPTYPESTREAGITGTVILKVQILKNGRAGDVSIKQSSGNSLLDESAVDAIHKWRFTPAKEKNTGQAVVCSTTVPIVFRIIKES